MLFLRWRQIALVAFSSSMMLLWSFTASQADTLEESPEVQFLSVDATELREKAAELADPASIYEYVRNNYEYVVYHGSRSGSINTFLGGQGNEVDLASTLIAMLRSRGIPARYVVGIPIEKEPWREAPRRYRTDLRHTGIEVDLKL